MSKFKEIDLLRFPLIILVVYAHMLAFSTARINFSWDVDDIYVLLSELISTNLGRLPVPCFFLFSGYFFFLKVDSWTSTIYAQKLKARFFSILIPYLLWNVLYILIILLKNYSFHYILNKPFDQEYAYVAGGSIYNFLWSGPIYFAFWYLRDLICMSLLSPVFYYLFKYLKSFGILVFLGLYLTVFESNIPGFSSTAIFYYGLGCYLGINNFNIINIARSNRKVIVVTSVLLLCVTLFFNGTAYYEFAIRLFTLVGVWGLLCLGTYLVKNSFLTKAFITLVPSVFFIYAIHQMYILGWVKGFFQMWMVTNEGFGKIIAYFVTPFICILICVLIYNILKKFTPRLLSIFIGGRI